MTRLSWLALALLHAAPAAVFLRPSLADSLYGQSPEADAGILIVHRGALFAALVVLSVFAAFDPAIRRAASCAVAISVLGFLITYVRGAAPPGPLRSIALADAAALLPLGLVLVRAWR